MFKQILDKKKTKSLFQCYSSSFHFVFQDTFEPFFLFMNEEKKCPFFEKEKNNLSFDNRGRRCIYI